MDPITDEKLAEAVSKGFDMRSLVWAGGERLVMFNVKASRGMEILPCSTISLKLLALRSPWTT